MLANKQNNLSRVSLPDYQGGSLEEYIELLYNQQKTCEKTGKYMQAEAAKKRLTQVREQLQAQRRADLLARFEEEKRQVETAHLEEISEFNTYWDGKMLEYQAEAEKMEADAIQRHEEELSQFVQQVEQSLGQGCRDTGEMINLRRMEESLAKQEKYVEAHRVQRQLQQLERANWEKWEAGKQGKLSNLVGQLRAKQENELSALRQKIEQGFEEQKRIRNGESEKLVQKYHNFIKELEAQHHQDVIRFEKSAKMQSNASMSRVSQSQSQSRALQQRN